MPITKKKSSRITKNKPSLNASSVVIVRHVTVPVKETPKLKKINAMLANAKLMD